MLQTTPLSGLNIIGGSAWVFGGSWGGLRGSFWAFSNGLKNLIEAEFISQHLYTLGPCSFGSMLSIHTLSDRLSFVDPADTWLFYLRHLKVKIGHFEKKSKFHWGGIYFSASIHPRTLFFWLNALHPYTIQPFEFRWPSWHLPFLPRRCQSQIGAFLKKGPAINIVPLNSPGPAQRTDWPPLPLTFFHC